MILKLNQEQDGIKLIQIENELYLIGMKAEIKYKTWYFNDWCNGIFFNCEKHKSPIELYSKSCYWNEFIGKGKNYSIIASTKQLGGCLKIQSKEDEVEKLAYETLGEFTYYGERDAEIGSSARSYYETEINGFKAGYKANKGYSEEQMREAMDMSREKIISNVGNVHYKYNYEKIIQSLKQPQVEITFEGAKIKSVKQIQ